jgi:predicted DCC family thiol-disulfide oxidoreductase YuxK
MQADRRYIVFYDGGCGLCHAGVRFLARRDRDGVFAFAPLDGETFTRLVGRSPDPRPESFVLRTPDGRLLYRSAAAFRALGRLRGPWPAVARIAGALPRRLTDFGYDLVARMRSRLFARPTGVCPVLPPELRDRFLP